MKYYTAFLFKDIQPNELHVTHKYLGELDGRQYLEVFKIVSGFFSRTMRKFPYARFDQVTYFGPEKNIRVLTSVPGSVSNVDWFPLLRIYLDVLRRDDWEVFTPHVTTVGLSVVDEPFSGYALVGGGRVLAHFPNSRG